MNPGDSSPDKSADLKPPGDGRSKILGFLANEDALGHNLLKAKLTDSIVAAAPQILAK